MFQVLIASGNRHKHIEIARILDSVGDGEIELITPQELDRPTPPPDPVEDGSDYLENATLKATAFSLWSGLPALADDSGVEVDALGGAPGLHSARYAGPDADFAANIAKLLSAIEGIPPAERTGRFVCALALCLGKERSIAVEGSCSGTILDAPRDGVAGFGYDPIFKPTGETRSFAEMTEPEKDRISHRGRALRTFREALRESGLGSFGGSSDR